MTVLDNTPRDQYTATGGQVAFSYTFEIAAEGDIAVLQNGVLLSLGAGAGEYAVTGVGSDTGGVVTLVTGATAGDIITLYRDMALERLTSYTNGGDFLAADVNNDYDRLWLALQQNTGVSTRALVAPNTDPTNINMTIPDKATRLGKYLRFNDTTGNPEAGDAAGLFTAAGLNHYNFTGDGATVNFTLGMEPGGENNTQVYIDGVYQQKDGYNVSGAVVQFSVAPPNLSTIEVMVIEVLPVGATTASQVSFTQAGSTYARNVQLKLQESVSVTDFGAVGDGVTDDALAIRKALDFLTVNGGTLEFENGKTYYVSNVVFIPWNGDEKRYLCLDGNGCRIKGTLSTNIFETAKTTTSTGGVTNFDDTPEGYLHGNIHIKNFIFETYNVAIKLYNAIYNSSITGNFFSTGKTAIHAKRCFYLSIYQNTMRIGYVGKPDSETTVILDTYANIVYFNDNHISNITTGPIPSGTGISVSGGGYALTIAECGIEGCKVGLTLAGENNPIDITGNYFEANEKSIVHTTGTLFGTVSGNWFYDPVTFESSGNPSLEFVNNNNINSGDIISSSALSSLRIRENNGFVNSTGVLSNLSLPSNYTLSSSAIQMIEPASRVVYDPLTGLSAGFGRSTIPYEDMVMPFNYFGIPQKSFGGIPFGTAVWDVGTASFVYTTRISYTTNYMGGIEYDLTVNDSVTTYHMSGRTLNDGSVVAYDATGKTVAVSNSGGYVVITIGAFSTATTPTTTGRIRVV
jgi:hypothetical protein